MTLLDDGERHAAFGLVHVTLEGQILAIDAVYAGLLGIPASDAIGRRLREFTDALDADSPELMVNILVRTGEPLSVRRTFRRPDGSHVSCTIQICLLRDAAGAPHSVIGVAQSDPPG